MLDQLEQLKQEAVKEIVAVESLETLNDLRVKYLGKKGPMTEIMKQMGKLSAEERPKVGAIANEVREELTNAIQEKQEELGAAEIKKQLANETIDVTLPGTTVKEGTAHLLTQVIEEIEDLFIGMGYSIAEGPEVEKDYYNFEALNLPKDHPARDMQDSFYITENTLLRTQTSPVQARVMEQHDFANGPIKIICPGKVYRRDNDDATHSHQFTQIEGLVVDENITLADLKGTLTVLAKKKCLAKSVMSDCVPAFSHSQSRLLKWIFHVSNAVVKAVACVRELAGLKFLVLAWFIPMCLKCQASIQKKYSGFAFGMGPERVAMLKYAVDDIRHLYTNDLRFTKQFSVKE